MFVINRKNEREAIRYDKITDRNVELSLGLNVNPAYLSKLVIESLKDGMTTSEIDELSAETSFFMSTYEPDYDVLATRISVSNLHKQTLSSFSETVKKLYYHKDEKTGRTSNIISDAFMSFVEANASLLDEKIDYSRDYNYNYFGFKTLCRMYLHKIEGKIVERPQHMLMRVAVCIHIGNIDKVFETYEEMSKGTFTHASPTLFNAGSRRAQLASCFLLKCEDDLEHIYDTNKRSALISKYGGGIGIDITNIRCKGSIIHANNGKSDGLIPMCKVFNATANYCNQQGRRKGSIAMYLQPWHPDILEFLALRYNNPPEELRARELFTAMWIPDIFMRRVEVDEMWSLIDPNVVRELCDTYGEEFDNIYEQAEKEGKFVKQIKAREVWKEILHSQQETGLPYIAYKDSINSKSNQMNIGLIRSSNLCCEILEFTDTNSVAVCNLSSVSLPSFIKDGKYNFSELGRIVKIAVKNLNNVIDRTYYPVVEAERNNLAYRPIGLGIQGLSDVFSMFKLPWGSENATTLNRLTSEVMYYYELEASHEFAVENEKVYSASEGSPVSKGVLQYDMWGVSPLTKEGVEIFGESLKLDWEGLKEKCKKGVSNSLLIALMPTATSSQILGNNECLTGDTQISLTNGLSVKIEDFIENNKVLSFDEGKKTVISSDKINLINQGIKNVLELTFQDGSTIRCTEDHKFLTKEGWIEAKDLLNRKIISSYKGILDVKLEDENDYLLDIKPNCLYMKTDREKLLALSRIIGYLTGDGHIEKNCKTMTLYFGCKQDVNMFYNDLSLFTTVKPKIQKNTRGLCVDIPVDLKNILKQFNLTEGRKSTSSYKHPDFILEDKCPLSIVREYIAGHFGADGVSPFLCKPKKQTSFIGSIALGHDIDENNIDSLKTYMEQLQKLLLKFGITSTIKSPRISATKRIRTEQNFYNIVISLMPGSNFGEKIGFRYCWSKMIRCCIGTSYYKYRENVLKQRQYFSSYVDTSKLSVKKALERLNQDYNEPILYGSLLKDHYKRNQCATNLKNFKGYSALEYINLLEAINYFEDPHFIKDDKEDIELPTFTFTVIHIKNIDEPQNVYDISVNSTHNFIANSVVVHNCFEPVTSNIYTRSTNSGDYIIVNKHLARDLKSVGLWKKDIVNKIIENNGSVQSIDEIPAEIKEIYKTVWEISQKIVIDYAADRAPFVDQTQSMNIFIDQPSYAKLSSMHLYGWKKGLKTGSYYIRSKPSRDAVKFTILKEKKVEGKKYVKDGKEYVCNDDVCVACSS